MPISIICPKSNRKVALTEDNAHIEPHNRIKNALVVKCVCGQIHQVMLPFVKTESSKESHWSSLIAALPQP